MLGLYVRTTHPRAVIQGEHDFPVTGQSLSVFGQVEKARRRGA